MIDLQQQSLRGAALYNPHLHSKDELIALFVARQGLHDLLLEDLRATASGKTPQHHLILGQRGMGKTMLLRRLSYAIEEDPVLGESWLALTFPEEQYNVAQLSDFWLNCTDTLSDLLETRGRHAEAKELDDQAEALRRVGEERRAREALALLVGTVKRIGRRLVLLVDNVDLVFERIRDQEWALREVLQSEPSLVLIGASANAVESSFTYDQAFYDFFRVHELEGLSLEETRRLLVHYAEFLGLPEVKRLAEQEPARIKVLHTLTGGNPRTVVLLFNVLAAGVEGDVRTDLERLLDQCTPLYKARFEALPAQAQQVVHALAVHWDPISAGELAEQMRMDVNAVSSQLNRLAKQGVVEKVEYEPETKTGFQIAERFFNIWYLMRASRRVRRQLLWLVEFLKMFYSQGPDALSEASGILAATLAHRGDWGEAAKHARKFVAETVNQDLQGRWHRTLAFFREAVRAGKAREALEILAETGAAERWRPLREALEAVARGSDSYLRRVAPEVRQPAKEILARLREAPPDDKQGAEGRTKRPRTKRTTSSPGKP